MEYNNDFYASTPCTIVLRGYMLAWLEMLLMYIFQRKLRHLKGRNL